MHNLDVISCQELQRDILSEIIQPEILAAASRDPDGANRNAPVVVKPNIAVSAVDSTRRKDRDMRLP